MIFFRNLSARMVHALTSMALIMISPGVISAQDVQSVRKEANQWRQEHRFIDLHQHIAYQTNQLTQAIKIMDASGIGIGVNLSGGTTVGKNGGVSAFQKNKKLSASDETKI